MEARLNPDQKVACLSHVGVTGTFEYVINIILVDSLMNLSLLNLQVHKPLGHNRLSACSSLKVNVGGSRDASFSHFKTAGG